MSRTQYLPPAPTADVGSTTLKGLQLKIEDPWSLLIGYSIIDHS
ncbi:hypothetical protein LJR220_002549 [Bradyrhizobium sp. LjRoot220]